MNRSILIIGIIYNTYPETVRYIGSIAGQAGDKVKLILVDNSNRPVPDDFVLTIAGHSFIHYIPTGQNLGYFGGARLGLKEFLTTNPGYPDWVLVTNVDICFTPGFFEKLAGTFTPENLGMIAPSIISQRWNTDYNPKIPIRYTLKQLKKYQILYSNFLIQNIFLSGAYLKKWMIGKRRPAHRSAEGTTGGRRKIYGPHGSCMIFAKNYFEKGGTLDLPNFLFGEEVFVAEACLKNGLEVIYDPSFMIRDHEHASTGFFVSPQMNRYFRESVRSIIRSGYKSSDHHGA